MIEQSGQLMRRLVEDLLDASRSMAGTLTLNEAPIATLEPELEKVIASHRLSARDKGVLLYATLDRDCGPLFGDAQRLQQVVNNLLGNALKFTPAGGSVRVTCTKSAGALRLSVSDTGVGIAPDALQHVFEQYWMADRRAGRNGGLGLGLAIVRSIVELHGGTIVASSDGVSRGAQFEVRLPLATHAVPDCRAG
jgi:signal transduction histidine kinase